MLAIRFLIFKRHFSPVILKIIRQVADAGEAELSLSNSGPPLYVGTARSTHYYTNYDIINIFCIMLNGKIFKTYSVKITLFEIIINDGISELKLSSLF